MLLRNDNEFDFVFQGTLIEIIKLAPACKLLFFQFVVEGLNNVVFRAGVNDAGQKQLGRVDHRGTETQRKRMSPGIRKPGLVHSLSQRFVSQ